MPQVQPAVRLSVCYQQAHAQDTPYTQVATQIDTGKNGQQKHKHKQHQRPHPVLLSDQSGRKTSSGKYIYVYTMWIPAVIHLRCSVCPVPGPASQILKIANTGTIRSPLQLMVHRHTHTNRYELVIVLRHLAYLEAGP